MVLKHVHLARWALVSSILWPCKVINLCLFHVITFSQLFSVWILFLKHKGHLFKLNGHEEGMWPWEPVTFVCVIQHLGICITLYFSTGKVLERQSLEYLFHSSNAENTQIRACIPAIQCEATGLSECFIQIWPTH